MEMEEALVVIVMEAALVVMETEEALVVGDEGGTMVASNGDCEYVCTIT